MNPTRRDAVLERLGIGSTTPSVAEVYRAWCLNVPFDNLLKLLHLGRRDPGPLPGATTADFFDAFLRLGVGATCWPTSAALRDLLVACGFDAWRLAGTMRDDLIAPDAPERPNHGGVVARIDGDAFLVDPSVLCEEPLLLMADTATETEDPLVGADAEPLPDGGWRVTFAPWRPGGRLPCRFDPTPVDDAFCAGRYEFSRTDSPFNQVPYVRRNLAHRLQILVGDEYWVTERPGAGTAHPGAATMERVGDRRSLAEILVDDFAISESVATAVGH